MRITNTLLLLLSTAVFFSLADTSDAQIRAGKYQIVGTLNNGVGFHGRVDIKKTGPVSVKLNNGYTLWGRVDARGNFLVTSVRGYGSTITASGSVSMRNRSYAISSGFRVRGEGKGIFMMGRL
jgi:sRNA-binding regulator protein Hfq